MEALVFITIILDFFAIHRVIKDEVVLFDNEKPKFIFLTILLPIIGAIIAIVKTSNSIKLRDKELQKPSNYINKEDDNISIYNRHKLKDFIDLID